jgi:hypothetical protein
MAAAFLFAATPQYLANTAIDGPFRMSYIPLIRGVPHASLVLGFRSCYMQPGLVY